MQHLACISCYGGRARAGVSGLGSPLTKNGLFPYHSDVHFSLHECYPGFRSDNRFDLKQPHRNLLTDMTVVEKMVTLKKEGGSDTKLGSCPCA
jgi:hypothetical protein